MRILLIGEYSNLHFTLATGLRSLGHHVTVASDGDGWKNYQRDIDITRKSYSLTGSITYTLNLAWNIQRLTGYDVVQIINPIFLNLKADKNLRFYKFLKKHNSKVFLGAFGVDHYWVKACLDKTTFRYSDFYYGDRELKLPANKGIINDWLAGDKAKINIEIAETCDGIVACLYEYYVSYLTEFTSKLKYIPLPIDTGSLEKKDLSNPIDKVTFFIGIQAQRSVSKGTDVIYDVLQQVHKDYPNDSKICKVVSVPYHEYEKLMSGSDVLIDQLYSYTPAMNGLTAMGKGLVLVGGGEPEYYHLQGEKENKPIINVVADRNDIYEKLEQIIKEKHLITERAQSSICFVEKHHDHIKVAAEYIAFWSR